MKLGCCGLGIFGMILKAINKVLEAIIAVIVYLGLYVPMFYLLVILGLWLWGDMQFTASTELTLFYVGLVMSLICSITITLRHLIFEPFGAYLDRREEQRALRQMERDRREPRRDRRRPMPREDRQRYPERPAPRYEDRARYRERVDFRERPRVYRSRYDRSLIIYEFSDRFEVYREDERGLYRIDTKWK